MIAVGVDVSKSKSTVAIISDTGEIIQSPKEYCHTYSQLQPLIALLKKQCDEVKIVMEATGHYHYPILKIFLENHFFVSVVNPYIIKKYNDNTLRKVKTDKQDALRLAFYALEKSHCLTAYTAREAKYADLKFLYQQYTQRLHTIQKEKVNLCHILEESMPGLYDVLATSVRNPEKNLLYAVVKTFKSFEYIKQMSQERFFNRYSKLATAIGSRKRKNYALLIYEMAQNSICTRGNDLYTSIALEECLNSLILAEKAANRLCEQMNFIANTLPEYITVRAMHGVGDKLAPQLIALIGDVRKFKSGKALNAYAGNDAPPYQSGQFESKNRHISKRGSTELRKICFEIMCCIKVHKTKEDPIYCFMKKKEEEGKAKKVAIMAGVNKFLRTYYAKVMEVYKDI